MARRIRLYVDILHHINELTFKIYRSLEPDVNEEDTHVMDVVQQLAVKQRHMETGEILKRNAETPYAFHVSRHFETDMVLPQVYLGADLVDDTDLFFLSDRKEIEIHSGDIGVFDGRTVYMNYQYLTMPLWDDYETESGKTYFGPPATGLKPVTDFALTQDPVTHDVRLTYTIDRSPLAYYYRIIAEDTSGSYSPWSDTKMIEIAADDIYFRIQRSPDGESWKEVTMTNLEEWFDGLRAIDNPMNVQNARISPLGSKETSIVFDNPWYYYQFYPRQSYQFRVRAEDDQGEHTDWLYLGPITIYVEPKEIVIRRKLDNGTVSTKEGIDAFTVFTLTKADVDVTAREIELIDDQLTDTNIYSYTFFYEDEIELKAQPFYLTSDHTPWKNVIIFGGMTQEDKVTSDFMMTFELADKIIEIGVDEEVLS